MLTIDQDLLQPMVTKVLTMVQKLLLKCIGENAHQNYDIVLPWKQAAWPDDWNEFVDGVIMASEARTWKCLQQAAAGRNDRYGRMG